mgnify:FL=1
MKLKEKIDVLRFLSTVKLCEGAVIVMTGRGKRLNLKSSLSQQGFIIAYELDSNRFNEKLVLENEADYLLLKPFITVQ